MVYIGDSATDVPCMKLVNSYGGHSIGVYNPNTQDKSKVYNMMAQNRIKYFEEATYTKGSELEKLLKGIIDKTAATEVLEEKYYEYSSEVEEYKNKPTDYEIYATYETQGNLEDKKLHKLIDNLNPDLRVSKSREFFVMEPEEAYELLESISIISGSTDKLKRVKIDESKKAKIKKPPINFKECGIPIGAELVFIENPEVKVVVCDDRKVEYNNEITSLTAVARQFKGYKNIAGPSFFTYNGRLVTEIAHETQWKDFQ